MFVKATVARGSMSIPAHVADKYAAWLFIAFGIGIAAVGLAMLSTSPSE